MKFKGKLYICATPIGNLEDVTLRVLRILKEADLVAAEDTRKTRKLFSKYQIRTPLTSYYEHNEETRGKVLIKKLREGKTVALVSEAGMPGISDPGHKLIRACIEENIDLEVLPGPSALISSLVISGLPTDRFTFQGFLPRKTGERRNLLKKLAGGEETLVFYESPHRLRASLGEILSSLGDRKIAVVRELTKKFEEVLRGSVSEIIKRIEEIKVRGEIVLVVEGSFLKPQLSADFLRNEVFKQMKEGISKKDAITRTSREKKVSKKQVYEAAKDLPAFEN